ncbi:terminase, partial [Lactobacillus crispatus]|nr:terminase [Lactobacillus crispatus]
RLNIAMTITNENSVDASMYLLDYKMKLKEKAAQASLTRAKAKETKMQAELLEQQLKAIRESNSPDDAVIVVDDISKLKNLRDENESSSAK